MFYTMSDGSQVEVSTDALCLESVDGSSLGTLTKIKVRKLADAKAEKPRLKERTRRTKPVSRLPRLQKPKCNLDVMRAVRSMGAKERLQFATS